MNTENVILATRRAFKQAGLEVPAIIVLASPEEGMKVRSMLALGYLAPAYILDGTTEYMQLEVAGVLVRWPCTKVALPGGKVELR